MNGYLLDTDICIFLVRGLRKIKQAIEKIGERNCFLSEITVAELRFGAERSGHREKEHRIVELMCENFTVLPISGAIRIYAAEKARLWSVGLKLDDFDILIGSTAIRHGLTIVTNNVKHFERMQPLSVENWTE